MVTSLASRVLAEPSACLPARSATSWVRIGTPVPSIPRYMVGATSPLFSTGWCSSTATSAPSASAALSTCLALTCTPPNSCHNPLFSSKLTSGAAPHFRWRRNPSRRSPDTLRVFRFPRRFRFEGRFGAPFFGRLSGGRRGRFQLGIGPLFTSLPILLHLFPKRMPLFDLLLRELGLFRAQIPGVGFACHRPCQAVIGAVTRFGVLLAGAACFTAFHCALGDRPPAHRFRLRQNCGQLTNRRTTMRRIFHGSILRHYMP